MQSNRFKAFSDSDQSDQEEHTHKSVQQKQVDNRPRAEKRKEQKEQQTKNTKEVVAPVIEEKQSHKLKTAREGKQPKGVSEQPHPLDKHSGSGLKTHDRKGGAGQRNWGTYKDDLQENQQENKQEGEEVVVEQEVEEEQLTLEEYFAKTRVQQNSEKIETKGNQDYTEFTKEGCQVISKDASTDDYNPTKKKKINDNYIAMQNTDLLGFRTGLKTYAFKVEEKREFDDKRERQPRENRQNKEQQNEVVKQVTPKVEGEQEVEQVKQEEVVEQKDQQREERQQQRPYRGNNNYRGNNQRSGGQYNNERRGQYNKQNVQKTSVKVNFEDDSLFPKLG